MKAGCPSNPSGTSHCPHAMPMIYTSYPPQWDEKCCHCGAVERVHAQTPKPPPGCGPFHPDSPLRGTFGGSTITGNDTGTPDLKETP